MKKPLSIGVVGTGMWGDNHIGCLKEDGRVRVAWLCERRPETLAAALQKHGVARGTGDYHEMLNDRELDAVIITTPPFTHAPIAIDALRAGKHVLLEKPMAHSRADMQRLLRAAARHPHLVKLEASCRIARTQPKFTFVKNLIASGALGDVYHIHHAMMVPTMFYDRNPQALWSLQMKYAGGGPMLNWGGYDLAFHLGVLNDRPRLKSLRAVTRNDLRTIVAGDVKPDVEQHALAFMEFTGGLTYYYERGESANAELASQTRIHGTKAGIKFSYLEWDSYDLEFYAPGKQGAGPTEKKIITIERGDKPENCNVLPIRHFIDCILGKAKPMMPFSLAAKHLDIAFKILESGA